ncbi:MAG: hypothetical protein DWQ07_08540 [Chloroflexi bacterium]|nr:MAG: hypothetical protein DWQ07_08540 [Chloroflexota bacterium]MBL1193240.1 hypothetical protein [Chloroflexota bacterium]NOH10535.1 hypothetical protein [Chloroflexota bacterium]
MHTPSRPENPIEHTSSVRTSNPRRPRPQRLNLEKLLWQGKPLPAFWTVGAAMSILLNVILVVTVILLGREVFALKELITRQLVAGLYANFILMDQASISLDVPVTTDIPVQFDLTVQTDTTVTLTESTRITNAQVSVLSGPTDIVLPAGTELPVNLEIIVPVDTTVPVNLIVPVDIQLSETDLHEPFTGLQGVVAPYYEQLIQPPNNWWDVWCRGIPIFGCR